MNLTIMTVLRSHTEGKQKTSLKVVHLEKDVEYYLNPESNLPLEEISSVEEPKLSGKEERKIRTKRFKEMEDLGNLLYERCSDLMSLLSYYQVFKENEIISLNISFLKKKLSGKPLRAYYATKIYDYLNSNKDQNINHIFDPDGLFKEKLPLLFEMVIAIQYLDNQILDGKYEVSSHKNINRNLNSSNVLRGLVFQYLKKYVKPHLNGNIELYELLYEQINELLLRVDIGQGLDKEKSNYSYFNKERIPLKKARGIIFDHITKKAIGSQVETVVEKYPDKKDFIELYFQRVYLTNTYFFRAITKVVGTLMKSDQQDLNDLFLFSERYGLMLQVVNDVTDYAYSPDLKEQKNLRTVGKFQEDVYSDLRNDNITLPLIFHLYKSIGRGKIEEILRIEEEKRRSQLIIKNKLTIKEEIVNSGAIEDSMEFGKLLADSAISSLSLSNSITPILKNMCDIARRNKFYKVF